MNKKYMLWTTLFLTFIASTFAYKWLSETWDTPIPIITAGLAFVLTSVIVLLWTIVTDFSSKLNEISEARGENGAG
jgi:hypothetical protein